jgi:hypothetical protein
MTWAGHAAWYWGHEKCIQNFNWKTYRKEVSYARIMLKVDPKGTGVSMWSQFDWFKIGFSSGIL